MKMILTQNQVDPSKTLKIRQQYTNQQRRIFAEAMAHAERELEPLPENPTHNQIEAYKAALLLLLMAHLTNGTATVPYVQAAYLRGVINANLNLRAAGIAVTGAETAVLTQANHRFGLVASQDQTQAMIRKIYVDTVEDVANELYSPGGIGETGAGAGAGAGAVAVTKDSIKDRIKKRLKKGLNTAVTVGATAVVGIAAKAFLNRAVDFGVALVSPIVEMKMTTQGDDKVCIECQALAEADTGNGPGVYSISEAMGIIPVHWGCRCSWSIVIFKKDVPLLRFR